MIKLITPEVAKLVCGCGNGGGTEPGSEKSKPKKAMLPPINQITYKDKD